MSLITNTITVRGKKYLVSEMDGKTMAEVRKRLNMNDEKHSHEAYVTFRCCMEPKFSSADEVAELPHIVAKSVSAEAFRLTEDEQAKND